MQTYLYVFILFVLLLLAANTLPYGLIWLFIAVGLVVTVILGEYLYRIFTLPAMCIEKKLLGLFAIDAEADMSWKRYTLSFLLFNLFCAVIIFGVLGFQQILPFNPLHFKGMEPLQLFNTVCSFLTNTNWQSYSGEQTLSNFSQMAGITFAMFIGAASGLTVCIGFLRGMTNQKLGNFFQDQFRSIAYVLLPLCILFSLFFVSQGVPQTLTQQVHVTTIEGHSQQIAIGPVASLLAIKQLGTNGGGFFNANSAHPYENPTPLTNFVEICLELAIPMALVYLFGRWLKDRKQGWMIWVAMLSLFLIAVFTALYFERPGNPLLTHMGVNQVASPLQADGNFEGKEVRFGQAGSLLFATSTTATSSGAVNTMHDSLLPITGAVPLFNMMLNIVFGGVGVGLMGFLLYGVITVFLTGLMVGRTPEIFGKKLEKPEIILASIAILLHPLLILLPTAIAVILPTGLASLNNLGPHGFSEVLYAYTSAAANNGSAFAGLNANTPWYNVSLGIVIMLGRYVSIIALMAIAGSLLNKPKVEPGPGTLQTNTVLFTAVWLSIILIIGALTFVPVLVLGPIAEHLAMMHGQVF